MAENENLETSSPEVVEEAPAKPQKSKTRRIVGKVIYFALLAVFIGVFIYCAIYISNYVIGSKQEDDFYTDLADQVENMRGDNANDDNSGGTVPTGDGSSSGGEVDTSAILPQYQAVYEQNNDLVGWIKIPGTKIDYPVLQTVDNPNYYLDHNFEKKYSSWGAIYVREECDVFIPSDNVVLYGHHMKDGTMFAGLDAYKKKSYWEENQYFTFDTLYEEHTYQIIAVFKTSANIGEGFSYHIFNTAQNEEEFDEFMKQVHKLQMYNTGLTAEYGDMLLTLSTCEYSQDNGRFVVVAKRVS